MIRHVPVTIALGAAASEEVDLSGDLLAGVFCPAALTGAMSIAVKHPLTGVFNAGVAVTFAASTYVPIDPANSSGMGIVRVATDQNQAALRSFVLALRTE